MRQSMQSLAGLLVLLALATPAAAQVQTGSILVKAVDEQNAVVPGVTVTLSSGVLVAGTMIGVTDAGGVYRFPSLPPGAYTVRVELGGFQTIVREGLVVSVGQTTPIELANEGGDGVGERHGDRRVSGRGHDQGEREREPRCEAA